MAGFVEYPRRDRSSGLSVVLNEGFRIFRQHAEFRFRLD